eukprot:12084705-Prorocentrum_lima.AAC.1
MDEDESKREPNATSRLKTGASVVAPLCRQIRRRRENVLCNPNSPKLALALGEHPHAAQVDGAG